MHKPQQKRPELFSQKALQLWSFVLTLTVVMKRIKQKQHIKIQEKSQQKKKNDKPLKSTIYRPFGALEGTRIPGPLIKSQMLYRLSYERIHYKAKYNTILPNNITILPGKKQAFCTKNFPKAVIGQILPRTAPLQTGQEPVQSKQFITKLQPTCRAHFRAGQADPIGGLFP